MDSTRLQLTESHFVRALLVALFSCCGLVGNLSAQSQQPDIASLCKVMSDPVAFDGHLVKLRAKVVSAFELSAIEDPEDSTCRRPWLDYAPKEGEAVQGDEYDAELQRRPVFLIEDENMKKFDGALRAEVYSRDPKMTLMDASRYNVTATAKGCSRLWSHEHVSGQISPEFG